MSWQGEARHTAYVDTNLVGSGKISKAAIIGLAGGVWAASPGYNVCTIVLSNCSSGDSDGLGVLGMQLSADEQKAIVNAFNKPEDALAHGVRLAGQKFFTLRADDRSIYGKKQADGCIIVKTKQAVLVAEYAAPIQAAEATPVVEGLADYLIGVGY
ncbi:Profilin/allergen [Trametes cingulata]|nr:Profilin/allergen [Trametes cingulata]